MLVFFKTSAILNLLVRKILGWRLKNGQVEETKGGEGVKIFTQSWLRIVWFLFFFLLVYAQKKKGRKEKALLGSKHFYLKLTSTWFTRKKKKKKRKEKRKSIPVGSRSFLFR